MKYDITYPYHASCLRLMRLLWASLWSSVDETYPPSRYVHQKTCWKRSSSMTLKKYLHSIHHLGWLKVTSPKSFLILMKPLFFYTFNKEIIKFRTTYFLSSIKFGFDRHIQIIHESDAGNFNFCTSINVLNLHCA
jgi:hypothetical protein